MFGSFSGGANLFAGTHDPGKERPAPPLPTPVSFPDITALVNQKLDKWTAETHPHLFGLLCHFKRPADANAELFRSLNIKFLPECGPEDLLGCGDESNSFFPPKEWLQKPDPAESEQLALPVKEKTSSKRLYNGRPWPDRQEFYNRVVEVMYSNDDAFQSLSRTIRDGRPPPLLRYSRPFYEAIDNMSQFWDTSLDEYIPPESLDFEMSSLSELESSNSEEPRKRTKLSPTPTNDMQDRSTIQDETGKDLRTATTIAALQPLPPSPPIGHPSPKSHHTPINPTRPTPEGTYKGRRVATGSEMAPSTRENAVRTLLECAVWPFALHVGVADNLRGKGATVAAAGVAIATLRVPVSLSRRVWRAPRDRTEARAGIVEGPVLGISCRIGLGFAAVTDGRLDLLREVGVLLALAQERAREGKTEQRPGAGKWWTTMPRWGGATGVAVPGEYKDGNHDDNGNKAGIEQVDSQSGFGNDRRTKHTRRRTMTPREQAIEDYKNFVNGKCVWDPKAKYQAIGKDKDSPYDEIFLVSSLNHHISILKLRVHVGYLKYLETCTFPTTAPAEGNWSSPTLQRTRWYDLLKPDDRVEAFRVFWGLAGYLARYDEAPRLEKESLRRPDPAAYQMSNVR